jgi:hypothetical protein
MSLLIIIINFRTPQVTIDCLASLQPQIDDVPGTRVILVDNASPDDSVAQIQGAIAGRGWSRWVHLVASPTNTGFAGGNNLGIAMIKEHYPDTHHVLLLNSDTIAQPNVLKYCVAKMDAEPSIGLMSCMLLNKDMTLQNTARKLPTPKRQAAFSLGLPWALPKWFAWADLEDPNWDRRTVARDVDWVGGAFMLIRREVIDRLGGLDQRFFFYGEDAEYCHRIQRHGWKVRYDPGAAVVHLGGASTASSRAANSRPNQLRWIARYLLQRICYGRAAETLIRGVDITGFALRCFKMLLLKRGKTPEYAYHRDMLMFLLKFPGAAPTGHLRG